MEDQTFTASENDSAAKVNAGSLVDALQQMAECIRDDLDFVCSIAVMATEAYVPFAPSEDDDDDPVCDDEEVACSQAWVRIVDVRMNSIEGWGGDCASTLLLDLEVGVTRCIPVPEGTEAYDENDVFMATLQSVRDMQSILCSAMNCEVWARLDAGSWTPAGPMGGFYGGTWTFTAEYSF